MRVRTWYDKARFTHVVEMDAWTLPDPYTLQRVKIHGVEFVPWEDIKAGETWYTTRHEISAQALDQAGDNTDALIGYVLEDLAVGIAREMLKKLLKESPGIPDKIAGKSAGKIAGK
jgi:hypothetical protein